MKYGVIAITAASLLALAACGDKHAAKTDDAAAPAAPGASAPAQTGSAPVDVNDNTSLTASDDKLATGQYYDAYPLQVSAGEAIDLQIAARGFKPVIVILDSTESKVAEAEPLTANADGSWTVSYSNTFDAAGQYYVLVAAKDVGATGTYEATLNRGRVVQ